MASSLDPKRTCTCTCEHCADPKKNVDVCWKTDLERSDFHEGQILNVPLHASNMDPSLVWSDPNLNLSENAGPVYSKCRLVVVFRIFHKQMECLPIYTNGGKGLDNKAEKEKPEWISVKRRFEKDLPRNDKRQPLVVSLDMDPNSYLHITQSVTIECADWIDRVGRMEGTSFDRLHGLRADLNKAARNEAFIEDCRQRGR